MSRTQATTRITICASLLLVAPFAWAAAPITIVAGDLNENGRYDDEDLQLFENYLIGKSEKDYLLDHLDMNGDRNIDVADLSLLADRVYRQKRADGGTGKKAGGVTTTKSTATAAPQPRRTGVLRGDVDGSGTIDERDAILLMDIVGGVAKPKYGLESADFNADGRIDLNDLLDLVAYLWPAPEKKSAK